MFTNRDGGIIEPANFRRVWRDARGKKWEAVQPRSFRKAVATLIERESGALIASKQLGHSSDEIMRRFYLGPNQQAPDSRQVLEQFGT